MELPLPKSDSPVIKVLEVQVQNDEPQEAEKEDHSNEAEKVGSKPMSQINSFMKFFGMK